MLSDVVANEVESIGAKSRQRSSSGNGRMGVYPAVSGNPVLGRFLGVDPIIQAPDNSQSIDGYGYCLNNPLKYTDPSGFRYSYQDFMREFRESQLAGAEFFNNYVGWWQDLQKSNSVGAWQYYLSTSFRQLFPNTTFNFVVDGIPSGNWSPTQGKISIIYSNTTTTLDGKFTYHCPGEVEMSTYYVPSVTFMSDFRYEDSQGGGNPNYWLAKAGAIAVTTSAADGPIPIGEAVGAAVLTLAAVHDATVATQRYLNKQGVQYTLRTANGDIWKIGQTTRYNFTTNTQWRYSQSQLDAWGVTFLPEFSGNRVEILMVEKMKIWNYIQIYNTLPPGIKYLGNNKVDFPIKNDREVQLFKKQRQQNI